MRRNSSIIDSGSGRSRGTLPPHYFGDGSGGSGDSFPDYGERLRRARLGLAVGLVPVITLFLSFTVVYAIRQGWIFNDPNAKAEFTAFPHFLPWTLFLVNTAILLLSSLTIELARRGVTRLAALAPLKSIPGISIGEERLAPWLEITCALGLLFLSGQYWAWQQMHDHGIYLATTSGSSFVYLVTGMHAFHLLAGLAAIFYAVHCSLRQHPLEAQRIVIDVSAWFWHFLTALWIYVLGLLILAH